VNFLDFLKDNSGGLSATRLAFLLWVIGVLVAWCIVSVKGGSLQAIDPSVQTVLAILMTGKVVQRFGEKPEVPKDEPKEAPAGVQGIVGLQGPKGELR
jgi:hypothetical protein